MREVRQVGEWQEGEEGDVRFSTGSISLGHVIKVM